MRKGGLIISLDFELYWGLGDHIDYDEYFNYFEKTIKLVPQILALFDKYQISCTWATVGMLWNTDWTTWENNKPKNIPFYKKSCLSNYELSNKINFENISDSHFFARDLIEKISQSKNQEIGTHTYSHYYCKEPKKNNNSFEDDIFTAIKFAKKSNINLNSIVFPRNQFVESSLKTLKYNNIKTARINPKVWYWKLSNQDKFIAKIFRLIDSYTPLFSKKSYSSENLEFKNGILLNPASRFLRPKSKLIFLNKLRIKRIKNEMVFAAKNNQFYHLWWHPHNFAIDPNYSLNELEQILEYYVSLKKIYGFRSLNMSQVLNSFYQN